MAELVDVRLVGLPVPAHQRAAEHIDELLREFSYLDGDSTAVPARLLQIRDELESRFSTFTAGPQQELADAIERGDTTIDLVYRVPAEVGPMAQQASDILDEADEFCRSGAHLLTLAAPAAAVRYRSWYFGEFVRQAGGHPPTPWSEVSNTPS